MTKVIGVCCLLLGVVLLLVAGWIAGMAPAGMTLIHPGPLLLALAFAFTFFVIGFIALRSPTDSGGFELPIILGFQHVVRRWETFNKLTENEGNEYVLAMQIKMLTEIAHRKYSPNTMHIYRYFTGASVARGTFLMDHPEGKKKSVVKLDSIDNINNEMRKYGPFVRPNLVNTHGTPTQIGSRDDPLDKIEDKLWGAIQYDFLANTNSSGKANLDDLRTFAEYYKDERVAIEQVRNALNRIFSCADNWWSEDLRTERHPDVKNSRQNSLREEYKRIAGAMARYQEGLREIGRKHNEYKSLSDINDATESINLGFGLPPLYNPLHWITNVFQGRRFENQTWLNLRRDSIVHGDFHAGNILVTSDPITAELSNVWLIDFPHVHFGPTVQDLARLEADIKFGLILEKTGTLPGDPASFLQFERCLIPELRRPLTTTDLVLEEADGSLSEPFQRAWHAIVMIREKVVNEYLLGADPRPYYLALLHSTLPVLYYADRSPEQKLYALISASLLCDQLR